MRVFVASLATETNTFSPLYVDRSAFESGFYCPPGTHPDTPTLCSAPVVAARRRAKADGFALIEGTATWAEPAGLVAREAYESLRDEILDQLRAALPVDVVLFGLHGSMVARDYDDCEGDLLAHARRIAGTEAVIGAELDMHCHLSDRMVEAADVIVAFKEFPHTDFLERAEDLVDLCLRQARGEIEPVAAVFDTRAVAAFMTSREPGRSFVDRIKAMEGQDGILSITIAHGFTAADVYDMGTKVLVYADRDREKAEALAERLAREILGWGPGGAMPRHFKPDEAIAEALSMAGRPIVLADRWDNPGGGVAGDSTVMIEALMRHPEIPAAIGALWDPGRSELLPRGRPGRRDPAPLRRQGGRHLRSADGRDREGARHDARPRDPLRAEPRVAGSRGRDHDRHPRRRAGLHARPDLQPAGVHRPRDRPLGQEDRGGEILEPFLRRLLQDRGRDPLSRHRRPLPGRSLQGHLHQGPPSPRPAGPASLALTSPHLAPLDTHPWP
jgi:hypothetical protein